MTRKISVSILDLPEPLRSKRLADLDMTPQEYQRYIDGWEASDKRREAEAKANGTWDKPHILDDEAANAAVTFFPDAD